MEKMTIYEQLRKAPKEALKTIQAGRLKGMSDVNPMWRIKAMTEAFGPCGIGWKYEITSQWTETYGQVVKVFTNINLYIKVDGEWSDAIPGTGGSAIVTVESSGLYVSDEAYKMALTDALSVAMKALGVAADVYFAADAKYDTKYEQDSYVAQEKDTAPAKTKGNKPSPALMRGGQNAPTQPAPELDNVPELDDSMRKIVSECTSSEAVAAIWRCNKLLQANKEFEAIIRAKGQEMLKKEGKKLKAKKGGNDEAA